MIAIGHTSIGVIIGVAASELLPLSLPLPLQIIVVGLTGIASHYAMDLLPHGHYNYDMTNPSRTEKLKLIADFIFPIFVIAIYLLLEYGFGRTSWLVGAGVLGAQLPDIVNGLRNQQRLPNWRWLHREGEFHAITHWHNPKDPAKSTNEGGLPLGWSDAWQAAMIALAVILLWR